MASVWLPIPNGAEAGPSAVGSNRSTQRRRTIGSALRWRHASGLGRRDVIAILGFGVEREGCQKFCPMMTRMASTPVVDPCSSPHDHTMAVSPMLR